MNLILFGPPGAGKGTQGDLLAERFGLHRLSTGDALRDAIRDGTPRGRDARRFMDAGELVPDEVVLGVVCEIVGADDQQGYIFDGFPRTIAQAEALTAMLDSVGRPVAAVLLLVVSDDVVVRRLSGRRWCPGCGRVYHEEFDPPREPGRCDACGSELVQRDDDKEATVRRRLRVYRQQTEPVIAYYRAAGVPVHEVAGDASVELVQEELSRIIKP